MHLTQCKYIVIVYPDKVRLGTHRLAYSTKKSGMDTHSLASSAIKNLKDLVEECRKHWPRLDKHPLWRRGGGRREKEYDDRKSGGPAE